ncbi:MAG: hypothetical protein Q7J69_04075 [Candidatus Omnitrophota bacterium]|nr:hypothetical protein [Candidatus Omnitrophota bacterium]
MDIADSYRVGNLNSALNASWSPFYSWILAVFLSVFHPSVAWEFPLVHWVNFILYLCSFFCFEFFINKLLAASDRHSSSVRALLYFVFLWTSLHLTTMNFGADLCTSIFLFLALGILAQNIYTLHNRGRWILYGVCLGFSYLSKTVMFPFSFFALAALWIPFGRKEAPRYALLSLAGFLLVAMPFATALSIKKQRITYGEAGSIAYAWRVNKIEHFNYWFGSPDEKYGTPEHPPRILLQEPKTYEFDFPQNATFPLWKDPSYWMEGRKIRVEVTNGLDVMRDNLTKRLPYYVKGPFLEGLIPCLLILFLAQGRSRKRAPPIILAVLFFSTVCVLTYAAVHIHGRYVAAFIAMICCSLICWLFKPDQEHKKLYAGICCAMAAIIALSFIQLARRDLSGVGANTYYPLEQYEVAEYLKKSGFLNGEKIAYAGPYRKMMNAGWARLARLKIISHIDTDDLSWVQNKETARNLTDRLKSYGIKAIITQIPGAPAGSGWERINQTTYYVYSFKKRSTTMASDSSSTSRATGNPWMDP